MKKLETEILIVGGGPAGSTTALYLAKLGFDITLVEKKIFPRETLCGEFLSKEVTEILAELDILSEFFNLKPNVLKSFRAIDKLGLELKSDLSFEAFAMKRSVFDSFLIDQAKSKNVKVLQPAEVVSISSLGSGFISEIIDQANQNYQVKSKLVIAAYGKQNILDKKLSRDFVNKRSNLNGIKFHFPVNLLNISFADEIRIYTDDGLYCGMNQVNENELTICFLENRKHSKIPSRERLIEVLKLNSNFQNIFKEDSVDYIKSTSIYGTGNIYFGKRKVVERGVIMVGDAARVISPLAGDGIGMAMESAKLFLKVVENNNRDLNKLDRIHSDYKTQYEKLFSKRLRTAKIIQSIILNQNTRNIGFAFANKYPALLPYLIKFTRGVKTA